MKAETGLSKNPGETRDKFGWNTKEREALRAQVGKLWNELATLRDVH